VFRSLIQDARSANDETIAEGAEDRVFYRLPVWKRVIVMLGGPLMNLILATAIFTVLLSAIGLQQGTTTISSVSQCVVPAGSTATECAADDPESPAAEAGIKPGDVIMSVDGQPVSTFADATAIVQAAPGDTLDMVVLRDGDEKTHHITPIAAERTITAASGRPVLDSEGQQVVKTVGYVGMWAQMGYVQQPLTAGPQMAVETAGNVATMILNLPARLWDVGAAVFTGAERDPNGPLSVVGVGRLAGEVASVDAPLLDRWSGLLSLLGMLNIALFVFNLIPLLPLDGGHIVVALWDGVRRAWAKLFRRPPPEPVDATKLVPLTVVVAVLLIAMGALLLVADILKPVSLFQ
jgi:membrane-associated protease RseP (regulator of RpoE activity)